MKKAAILIEDHYEVLEAWYPYLRLREQGMETVFIGPEKKTYSSKDGYPAAADQVIQGADASTFDAVVIPGGYAPDLMRRNESMVRFVKEAFAANAVVAMICHAGWMGVSADIFRGRNATCFFAIKDDVVNAGARYRDEAVVTDGNLITSRTPSDLPEFCTEIIRQLTSTA